MQPYPSARETYLIVIFMYTNKPANFSRNPSCIDSGRQTIPGNAVLSGLLLCSLCSQPNLQDLSF